MNTENHYTRMFPRAPRSSYSESDLIALAELMVDDPNGPKSVVDGSGGLKPPTPPARSLISGLLYFGQFIDHDLSLDRTPLSEAGNIKPEDRINYSSPALDLGSLYGGGPDFSPHLYYLPSEKPWGPLLPPGHERFVIGRTSPSQQRRDLPRTIVGRPVIGDARNEENLILAQLHVLMLQFHNRVIGALEQGEIEDGESEGTYFTRARRLVTWHYQYIVLNGFLDQLLDRDILAEALAQSPALSAVPIEFALAGFRIGHSMIRNDYKVNDSHQNASLEQLLDLNSAGSPPLTVLPDDWIIDWRRFFDEFPLPVGLKNRSHGLDPLIAKALHKLSFSTPLGSAPNSPSINSLPAITLIRGSRSHLPSGQEVAKAFDQEPLTPDEMAFEQTPELLALLSSRGFMNDTPLWFYLLQEAAAKTNKEGLGPVGSWLVASTVVGLLKADPYSILNAGSGWKPPVWKSSKIAIGTMGDVVKIAFG